MKTISQLLFNKNAKSFEYKGIFRDLQKMQKKLYSENPEREMQIRIKNLQDVINVFNKYDISYWLQGKTLLGMFKDKKLIENDHDEDIGTPSHNMEFVVKKIIPKLQSNGFDVIRTITTEMVSVMRDFRYIDICFFSKKGNKYGYQQKLFPEQFYKSFTTITINEFDYNIPTATKKILNYSYKTYMKYGCILVWPHGFTYRQEIFNKISEKYKIIWHNSFKILNLDEFIMKLYKNEQDLEHIRGKNKFLLKQLNRDVYLYIFENEEEDVVLYGNTPKSQGVENLKRYIRNCYNPKLDDPNKRIAPLNSGVSHNHVIHSSDLFSEVSHICSLFNLNYKKICKN